MDRHKERQFYKSLHEYKESLLPHDDDHKLDIQSNHDGLSTRSGSVASEQSVAEANGVIQYDNVEGSSSYGRKFSLILTVIWCVVRSTTQILLSTSVCGDLFSRYPSRRSLVPFEILSSICLVYNVNVLFDHYLKSDWCKTWMCKAIHAVGSSGLVILFVLNCVSWSTFRCDFDDHEMESSSGTSTATALSLWAVLGVANWFMIVLLTVQLENIFCLVWESSVELVNKRTLNKVLPLLFFQVFVYNLQVIQTLAVELRFAVESLYIFPLTIVGTVLLLRKLIAINNQIIIKLDLKTYIMNLDEKTYTMLNHPITVGTLLVLIAPVVITVFTKYMIIVLS